MVEQLFTATGGTKGNEKERTEQLFTARREKQGKNESEKRRRGESESVIARNVSDETILAEYKDCFATLARHNQFPWVTR